MADGFPWLFARTPSASAHAAKMSYGQAMNQAQNGRFQKALALFQRVAARPEASQVRDPALGIDLREQGAYQAAICLKMLGKKREALQAFDQLLARFPSPMIRQGCRGYLLRLRDGRLTIQEARWLKGAEQKQQAWQRGQEWEQAACGPKALAYLLQQWGVKVSWKTLAHEAQMTRFGTSMGALARCARRRGFSAVGLQVVPEELGKQPLPALALLRYGHYVVVEQVERGGVHCWDPMGERRDWTHPQWRQEWDGYLLVVRRRT